MFIKPHLNTRGVGEFSKLMQTRDVVEGLQNCLEFSQPSSCLGEATYLNTEKVLYCLTSERGWSLLETINTDYPCSLMHSLGVEYYMHTRLQVSAE